VEKEELCWPENAVEWREAIDSSLAFGEGAGSDLLGSGEFPYSRLENWVRMCFTEEPGEVFVDAVVRNLKGLASWAYGGGSEPRWPGSDSDNPELV